MGDIDVDFFLGTLKNLISDSKINYVKKEKHQLGSLAEDIKYLREFLRRTEVKRKEHPEVMNLVVRIKDVVSKTENIIELFVARAYKAHHSNLLHCAKKIMALCLRLWCIPENVRSDLNDIFDLDDISLDLGSVKKEIMTLKVEVDCILDKDVSDINGAAVIEHEQYSSTKSKGGPSSSAGRDTYKVGEEREVVGFKDEVAQLLGKLHDGGDGGKLEIISIIGAGGGGKTTLAREMYDHPLTLQMFDIRAWVNVSQDYNSTMKRDLLISILKSAFPKNHEDYKEINEDKLGEKLLNCLKGKKYLLVMDDVWGLEAWKNIQRSFPREYTKSKVMFTSRQPVHPDSVGCIDHFINQLSDSCSWELLQKKVFKKGQCPLELVHIGEQIAKNCGGLPLAIVAIAGILATKDKTIYAWKEVAKHLSSLIAKSQGGTMEILELSYNHLPLHLKACFLYIGAHPKDFEIPVRKLIWLWIAEGFIHQANEGENLEAIAKDHLIDLIERNLIMVAKTNSVGTIKACHIHDLLRELCFTKGKEDNFFVRNYNGDSLSRVTNNYRRLFSGKQLFDNWGLHSCDGNLRSFLYRRPTFKRSRMELSFFAESYKLLRVLHMVNIYTSMGGLRMGGLRKGDLFHLRYLALDLRGTWPFERKRWSSLFCCLLNLEILNLDFNGDFLVPPDVLKMVRLRILYSKEGKYTFHHNYGGEKNMLESLQILHRTCSCESCLRFLKRAPNLRKLRIEEIVTPTLGLYICDLEFLKCLEVLCVGGEVGVDIRRIELKLPPTITRLTLSGVRLKLKQLSILLQTLPRLEVLKLHRIMDVETSWNTSELEEGFSQLKYLKLSGLFIKEWSASEDHFPRLEVLVIESCWDLEGIPIEFANLFELREITVEDSTKSAEQSARNIQEEQKNTRGDDACLNLVASSNVDLLNRLLVKRF